MDYKNPLILIYIISFIDFFAVGLIFPLLAPHLRDLGVSHTLIGALSSLYAGVQVISGPVIGAWTDINGRRSILKKILFICGVCYGLLGFTESFSVILIIRILLGIVKHIQSICKAVITDILPNEKHTEAFGKSAAISRIGFILGPLLGGQISEVANGFCYVCFLTMVLFFVNIGVAAYLPDVKKPTEDKYRVNGSNTILGDLKQEIAKTISNLLSIDWSKHWEAFTLRFLYGLAMSTFLGNQGLLLKEKYNLSQKYSGYVISYFSAVGTCAAFFFENIQRFFNNKDCLTKLVTYFLVMTLSIIAIYITPNIFMYICVLLPFSISSTALRIISMDLILQDSNGNNNGSLSGASNSVMSVPRLISSLLTGVLGDLFGEASVILVALVPALAGTFLSFYLKANQRVKHSVD